MKKLTKRDSVQNKCIKMERVFEDQKVKELFKLIIFALLVILIIRT